MLWSLAEIDLKHAVFVAFTGEDLRIQCKLSIPANQTNDNLTCSDPIQNRIYEHDIPQTDNQPLQMTVEPELKRLEQSGEYVCQYKTAKVFWFLHVRSKFGGQYTIIVIIIIIFRLKTIN